MNRLRYLILLSLFTLFSLSAVSQWREVTRDNHELLEIFYIKDYVSENIDGNYIVYVKRHFPSRLSSKDSYTRGRVSCIDQYEIDFKTYKFRQLSYSYQDASGNVSEFYDYTAHNSDAPDHGWTPFDSFRKGPYSIVFREARALIIAYRNKKAKYKNTEAQPCPVPADNAK